MRHWPQRLLLIPLSLSFLPVLLSVLSFGVRSPNFSIIQIEFFPTGSVIVSNNASVINSTSLSLWGYCESSNSDTSCFNKGPLLSFHYTLCNGIHAPTNGSKNASSSSSSPSFPCKDQTAVDIINRGGSAVCRIICVVVIVIAGLIVALSTRTPWLTTIWVGSALAFCGIAAVSDLSFAGQTRNKLIKLQSLFNVDMGVSFWMNVAGLVWLIASLVLALMFDCKLKRRDYMDEKSRQQRLENMKKKLEEKIKDEEKDGGDD